MFALKDGHTNKVAMPVTTTKQRSEPYKHSRLACPMFGWGLIKLAACRGGAAHVADAHFCCGLSVGPFDIRFPTAVAKSGSWIARRGATMNS